MVIGDPAVGKTSLIARYVHNEFPCHTRSHVNPDGSTQWETNINGQQSLLTFINVQPTDDLSQIKNRLQIPTGCFIVFSICDQRSFDKVKHFRSSVDLLFSNDSISVPYVIIANKVDLEEDRIVTKQSIVKLLESDGYEVIETSVKTGQGIQQALNTVVQSLQSTVIDQNREESSCKCVII